MADALIGMTLSYTSSASQSDPKCCTDLDGLASISQLVDLIEDDAVVLVALRHVCTGGQVDVLPKLLQDDLAPQATQRLTWACTGDMCDLHTEVLVHTLQTQ